MNRIEAIGNRITETAGNVVSLPIEPTFDGILYEALTGIEAIADQIAEDIPVYQARWLLKFDELQDLRDWAYRLGLRKVSITTNQAAITALFCVAPNFASTMRADVERRATLT
jgi:hypothetical protein